MLRHCCANITAGGRGRGTIVVLDARTRMDLGTAVTGPGLRAARIHREVATERLVNRARFIGVLLGAFQFVAFTDYLPGVRVTGLAIALSYGLVGLWSRRGLARRSTLPAIRRLTTSTLVADTVLLGSTALLLAYQDDPANLLLLIIALLEAAMKRQMPGALALAAVGTGVEAARVTLRVQVHGLPVSPEESTALAGMLLLVAMFAGGIVRLQVAAQEELARSNDRLDAMRRMLRAGLTSLVTSTGLQQLLREAVDGLALEGAVVRTSKGGRSGSGAVAWPPGVERDPTVLRLFDGLARRTPLPEPPPHGAHSPGAPSTGAPSPGDAAPEAVDGGWIREAPLPPGRQAPVDGAPTWAAARLANGSEDVLLAVLVPTGAGALDDADALRDELEAVLRASSALLVEEEMERARASLERLRHDVASITAHEIRTPVTVIKGGLETLDRGLDDEDAERIKDAIRGSVGRLELVVEHLRVLEGLDRGQYDSMPVEVDVGPVIADVAGDHGIDLPPADRPVPGTVIAWADEAIVRTVLACLVENAMTHGQGRDVRLTAVARGDRIDVDVSDAGPGIAHGARGHVFERFVAANVVNHHRGVGIGLPLARELARLVEGDVRLLDQTRTTFRLDLPRALPATAASEAAEPAVERGAGLRTDVVH